MMQLIGYWGHMVAGVAFTLLAIITAQRTQHKRLSMIIAALFTAAWAVIAAARGPQDMAAMVAEIVRDAGWLCFLYMLPDATRSAKRPARAVYLALSGVLIVNAALVLGGAMLLPRTGLGAVLIADFTLRMIFAVGALVLIHSLYGAVDQATRARLGAAMAALAAFFAYDLNLYTFSYLSHGWATTLLMARGLAVALLAPAFGLVMRESGPLNIRLSRTVALRGLALGVTSAYLVIMLAISALVDIAGGQSMALVQIGMLVLATAMIVVVLPSARSRAWLKVMASKHLFAHRYDYRAEWLRFTDTMGQTDRSDTPLGQRAIKAIADIAEAPAGMLLIPSEEGMTMAATWNWTSGDGGISAALVPVLATGRIIDLDRLRHNDPLNDSAEAAAVPEWMLDTPDAWAVVPLLHFDTLAGAVLLARSNPPRTLDWEDFDLLKVAGRQVASYLAEAKGQEKLSESQRFEEFNRRFAFIMHDIKNIVSQLSLVTRNAERHADNPEFQADMIATLNSSTAKMNDLLARLSQHHKGRSEEPRAVALGEMVVRMAAARRSAHPIIVAGDTSIAAIADPQRIETAIAHLIDNAVDASDATDPVTLTIGISGSDAVLTIADTGCGMTADFVRGELFRPFSSTKAAGFGIGAYEARALIAGMGGRLTVVSEPGTGSSFTITLPRAMNWQGDIARANAA